MKTLFGFDRKKGIAAILYLAKYLDDTENIRILKALYHADKYHLNRYLRFITGDEYVRMDRGPVASLTFDLLKGQGSSKYFKSFGTYIEPLLDPDMEELSPSDIMALDEAIAYCKNKTSQQLSELSHDDVYYSSKERHISAEDFVNHMENKEAIVRAHTL